MTNENAREVFRAHRDAQNRYIYFLLAASGACIALAVKHTEALPLAISQIPLALAVVAWGLSFYFGTRHVRYVNSNLYANLELIRVQSGEHPAIGRHPQAIAAASEGIKNAMASNDERATRLADRQFRCLVGGAVLYLVWHVFEMYLRTVHHRAP